MKAIIQDRYGSADVLRLEDVERPAIGDQEVLVRIRAASLDPGVWHVMTGKPYLIRVMGFGLRGPKTRVRGTDVAGEVVEVGSKVTLVRPGDEVFGGCYGSFAEYARAPQNKLAPKPPGVTFEQANVVDGVIEPQRYVAGGHGAALQEEIWDTIADFVLTGELRALPETRLEPKHAFWVYYPALVAPAIWLLIAGALLFALWKILRLGRPPWQRTLIVIAYLWLIWTVITKV